MTQSVGVPVTEKRRSSTLRKRKGVTSVKECEEPDCSDFGRDHPDIVAQRTGDRFGDRQTARMNAVVIGDQDAQLIHLISIFCMPIYGCKTSGMRMEPSLS